MSLDAFLNQTCTITRDVASGTDRYNNATTTPTTVASNLRCRRIQKTMRMVDERTGEYAFVRADLVLIPAGTTVKAKDKITISGVDWRVQTVLTRQRFNEQHHVSCLVEANNAA